MRHRVLIIEDEATLRRALTDNFAERGYDVQVAADGAEGLEKALRGEADLILLDIMLPKINGYEVCARIRDGDPETPILVLTAKGQEDDVVRGLELGADDYVTKPFSVRELVARVASLLRRRGTAAAARYRFGDCELDLVAYRLLRGGQEVELTPKELRLLELFVQRAGRALTRNEIVDRVWGRSVFITARSVDRCVTTLRAKIEPDPRQPTFIRTLREIGYRFEGLDEDASS